MGTPALKIPPAESNGFPFSNDGTSGSESMSAKKGEFLWYCR